MLVKCSDGTSVHKNLILWEVKTGEELISFSQKSQNNWSVNSMFYIKSAFVCLVRHILFLNFVLGMFNGLRMKRFFVEWLLERFIFTIVNVWIKGFIVNCGWKILAVFPYHLEKALQ